MCLQYMEHKARGLKLSRKGSDEGNKGMRGIKGMFLRIKGRGSTGEVVWAGQEHVPEGL